jgi:hypothetical protein
MRSIRVVAMAGLLIAALAACGPDTSAPAGAGPATSASADNTGGGAGAPTTLDPCQIVTQQEASALTGVSFGPGKQLQGALSTSCLYGAGSKNVFRVDVVRGTIDQVNQYRDQVTAEIETGDADGGHLNKSSVSGLGDEATAYTLTGSVLNVSSLFVIQATVALYLVNEVAGTPVPTTQLTNEARTALSRIREA